MECRWPVFMEDERTRIRTRSELDAVLFRNFTFVPGSGRRLHGHRGHGLFRIDLGQRVFRTTGIMDVAHTAPPFVVKPAEDGHQPVIFTWSMVGRLWDDSLLQFLRY